MAALTIAQSPKTATHLAHFGFAVERVYTVYENGARARILPAWLLSSHQEYLLWDKLHGHNV